VKAKAKASNRRENSKEREGPQGRERRFGDAAGYRSALGTIAKDDWDRGNLAKTCSKNSQLQKKNKATRCRAKAKKKDKEGACFAQAEIADAHAFCYLIPLS